METAELIKELGLKHLTVKAVEQIEEALNAQDEETMLAVVDKLIGQSKKPIKKKGSSHRYERRMP